MKLTIADPRQAGAQLPIWDWVGNTQFYSMAQTRNATGEFCEQATLQLMGGQRLSTQGNKDICPDIELSKTSYLEVKSVGIRRTALIYEHIHDRQVLFLRRNKVALHYLFWIHTIAAARLPDLFELRRQMAANIERVIVVPFAKVSEAVKHLPLKVMNYRAREHNGVSVPMAGWRIPVKQLKAWSEGQPRLAFDTSVFGYQMGGYPIYGKIRDNR